MSLFMCTTTPMWGGGFTFNTNENNLLFPKKLRIKFEITIKKNKIHVSKIVKTNSCCVLTL